MPLHVQGQVVAPRETSGAEAALERLGARVLPVVPREFVGPGEPPLAAFPGTLVRFLT